MRLGSVEPRPIDSIARNTRAVRDPKVVRETTGPSPGAVTRRRLTRLRHTSGATSPSCHRRRRSPVNWSGSRMVVATVPPREAIHDVPHECDVAAPQDVERPCGDTEAAAHPHEV